MKNHHELEVEAPNVALPVAAVITLKKILVPTDFSPLATRAVTYAHRLASQFAAQLILLHVIEPVSYAPPHCPVVSIAELTAQNRATAEKALNELAGALPVLPETKPVLCRSMVVEGDTASETNRVACECEVDLIVIATHAYTGLNHLLLGGTTDKVMRHAPCPVLVVREKERDFVPITPIFEHAA